MSDRNNINGRKGIHGWRALLLMIGCGTLAAVVLVGSVVGALRLLLADGDSSEPGEYSDQEVQPRKSRSSMEIGALDLCGVAETDVLPGMGATRSDGQGDPVDTGGNQGRTASDECEWSFTSQEYGVRKLHFSYEAYVTNGEGGEIESLASNKFNEEKEGEKSGFSDIKDEGEAQNLESDSYFYYGESTDGSGLYVVIARVKSAVYVAKFVDDSSNPDFDERYKRSFRAESAALDRAVYTEIERRLPD